MAVLFLIVSNNDREEPRFQYGIYTPETQLGFGLDVTALRPGEIGDDWLRAFGYRPVLIETFVDPIYFAGTCYRAANWQCLGLTQGRGRLAPDHKRRTSRKEIFVYPLQSDWQQRLTSVPRAAEVKKRYRDERKASRVPSIDAPFVALWEQVIHIFHEVAAEYDQQWRVRKRVIDTLMLMLLIFRLVCAKNTQSYGTTIDDLWDNCEKLKLVLPQKSSIAPSSFCAARQKLDEAVFKFVSRARRFTRAGMHPQILLTSQSS